MSCYRARFFSRAGFAMPAACLLLTAATGLYSQTALPTPPPNATLTSTQSSLTSSQIVDEMTRHNEARAEGLRHYESVRTYQVEYKGYSARIAARMVVEADF